MTRKPLKDAVSISTILDDFFQRQGKKQALLRHRAVELWPKIMDPAVVRHARAERVSGSVLHVVTDSSVWMNELAAIKQVILDKVNERLDPDVAPITEIRFHQRSKLSDKPQPADREPLRPTESDSRAIRHALEPVNDDDLRKILQTILERDRALKRSRSGKD